jgi:hypothetical protein
VIFVWMKPLLIFLLFTCPVWVSAQVVNFGKTIPERSFSLGVAPSYYFNNSSVGLRSIGVEEDQGGAMTLSLSGGYGISYSLDLNARIIYVAGGKPFFGADLQYLVYEARSTYISVLGGLHYWDNFGVDISGFFTYMLSYDFSLSGGLDFDINYDPDMDGSVRFRAWLPVNLGYSLNKYTFLYAEYDLQISQWSWGILALGANFIFR